MYIEIDMYKETPEIRREIDRVTQTLSPDRFVEQLPDGVTLIEPAHSRYDCEGYALGTRGIRRLLSGLFPNINAPTTGDLVLYHSENGGCKHVGVLEADGTVTSKWGKDGPVLNHPWDYVPNNYGEKVIFRRISPEERKRLQNAELSDSL